MPHVFQGCPVLTAYLTAVLAAQKISGIEDSVMLDLEEVQQKAQQERPELKTIYQRALFAWWSGFELLKEALMHASMEEYAQDISVVDVPEKLRFVLERFEEALDHLADNTLVEEVEHKLKTRADQFGSEQMRARYILRVGSLAVQLRNGTRTLQEGVALAATGGNEEQVGVVYGSLGTTLAGIAEATGSAYEQRTLALELLRPPIQFR